MEGMINVLGEYNGEINVIVEVDCVKAGFIITPDRISCENGEVRIIGEDGTILTLIESQMKVMYDKISSSFILKETKGDCIVELDLI